MGPLEAGSEIPVTATPRGRLFHEARSRMRLSGLPSLMKPRLRPLVAVAVLAGLVLGPATLALSQDAPAAPPPASTVKPALEGNRGPFEVAFTVYGDFPTYKSGVYVQTNNTELGGHAVRVVGWGTLDGVAYWKIANSWNTDWGLKGYFLIKRGVDECGIEDSGSAGTP